jgi:tetratricopeptide (TPR) repeat protein
LQKPTPRINPDSAFYYAEKVIPITKKLQLKLEEAVALRIMIYAQINLGNYPRSLQYLLPAIEMVSNPSSEKRLVSARYPPIDEFVDRAKSPRSQRLTQVSRLYQNAGILYTNSRNYEKALYYYKNSLPFAEESGQLNLVSITYNTLGRAYLSLNYVDSALYCLQKAYDAAARSGYNRYIGSILLNTGRVYLAKKQMSTAANYFRQAIEESRRHYYSGEWLRANSTSQRHLRKRGGRLFALLYAKCTAHCTLSECPGSAFKILYGACKILPVASNNDSTVKYQSLIIKLNDSTFNAKQVQQFQKFQNIDFDATQRKQQVETAKTAY